MSEDDDGLEAAACRLSDVLMGGPAFQTLGQKPTNILEIVAKREGELIAALRHMNGILRDRCKARFVSGSSADPQ